MGERPEAGQAVEVAPGVRRILAPNPSPMTHWGTNTYLVGAAEVAVIDPGPDDPAHLAAIRAALGDARVVAVLVTHAHRDHSTLAPRLAAILGAPVLGFGPPEAGRSDLMARLAAGGLTGGGEGVDADFAPDRRIGHGGRVELGGHVLEALHTPGHFAGHLSFALGDVIFTGDLVMGWASTLISPPDGDLTAFLASCALLNARGARRLLPGHGAAIDAPAARIGWLIDHRAARTRQVMAALAEGPSGIPALTARIYTETPPALIPAAERNVFAHLIALCEEGRVAARPALSATATFALARP